MPGDGATANLSASAAALQPHSWRRVVALPPPWPWAQGTLGHNTHEAWHGPAAPGDVEACYPQPICTTTEHSCGKPKEKRAEEAEEKTLKQVKNIQKAPKNDPQKRQSLPKRRGLCLQPSPLALALRCPRSQDLGALVRPHVALEVLLTPSLLFCHRNLQRNHGQWPPLASDLQPSVKLYTSHGLAQRQAPQTGGFAASSRPSGPGMRPPGV